MINSSALMIALVTTALAAESEKGLLKLTHEHIRSAGECRYFVGPGITYSLPVPVRGPDGVRYRQMFYRTHAPDGEWHRPTMAMPPGWFVEFNLDGTGVNCELEVAMPASEFGKPAGRLNTPATSKMNHEARDKEASVMLDELQQLAPAFANRLTDANTASAAKDFRNRFMKLAEPGLIPYYRALSPEFWAWLDGLEKPKSPKRR